MARTEPDPATPPGAASSGGAATALGARLDRLAWSPAHTTILLALGAGWLFDSFEVQLFSSTIGPLGDAFGASSFQRSAVLGVWLVGILVGAVLGGRLADRFGRRRLFVATLLWYAGFTVLTGLSPDLASVYVLRFLAALGVGAEYSIVNAALAELIPARVRGRAGAAVMAFWPAGAVLAAVLSYLVLDVVGVPAASSWRWTFVVGGVVALVVLFFRRHVPESPRWLLSRGRPEQAERIVVALEGASARDAGIDPAVTGPVAAAGRSSTGPVRPASGRRPLAELWAEHRSALLLGCSLDLAEAFGYYGIFALLSVVVLTSVSIADAAVPLFYVIGNAGAVVGGLAAASVLDRWGRTRTTATTYSAAAAGVVLLAVATASGSAGWVTAAFVVANAFATAAWVTAYPTFTELFPTHLRGAGVGTSVGVGRIGAIVGTLALPQLATALGATASYLLVVLFWLVGVAAVLVHRRSRTADAAGRSLEQVAPEPVLAGPRAGGLAAGGAA